MSPFWGQSGHDSVCAPMSGPKADVGGLGLLLWNLISEPHFAANLSCNDPLKIGVVLSLGTGDATAL
jgi:hypothetical protein